MIKKIKIILILIIIFSFINISQSFGYSNDIFEFDLPPSYESVVISDFYTFINPNDESKHGLLIYTYPDSQLKKSIWDIDDYALDKIISQYTTYNNNSIIEKDKKAKLGKEKAIRLLLKNADPLTNELSYLEIYFLASDNYIYLVSFVGDSIDDFSSFNYTTIKNSFNLKDSTTNPILIYIIIFIIGIFIKIFASTKKTNTKLSTPYHEQTLHDISHFQ